MQSIGIILQWGDEGMGGWGGEGVREGESERVRENSLLLTHYFLLITYYLLTAKT